MESNKDLKTNTKRNVLVVEDESFIAEMIKVMLIEMGHNVVAVALEQDTAKQVLLSGKVDFAIFDINLHGHQEGLELGRLAHNRHIPFMFLTSYSDRQTVEEAKLTKPGAYVVKPFTEEDLFAGIEMSLMHAHSLGAEVTAIKVGHKQILLKTKDILYLKAENIYVEVYTIDKRYLVRTSLSGFMDEHPHPDFIRVHRSYAVNRKHVHSHSKSCVFINGLEIPVSRSYRDETLELLV
jgi:DNA-binding LytR/AlgR family response regulator